MKISISQENNLKISKNRNKTGITNFIKKYYLAKT